MSQENRSFSDEIAIVHYKGGPHDGKEEKFTVGELGNYLAYAAYETADVWLEGRVIHHTLEYKGALSWQPVGT